MDMILLIVHGCWRCDQTTHIFWPDYDAIYDSRSPTAPFSSVLCGGCGVSSQQAGAEGPGNLVDWSNQSGLDESYWSIHGHASLLRSSIRVSTNSGAWAMAHVILKHNPLRPGGLRITHSNPSVLGPYFQLFLSKTSEPNKNRRNRPHCSHIGCCDDLVASFPLW
jgi:hypothetical protein